MISFGRLSDLINNAKGFDLDQALFFIFSQDHIQLFAIELNTGSPNNNQYGQLFLHGVDSEGVNLMQIGGEYAPITKDIKRFEGLPFDRITLYQDGGFYKSWEFIPRKDEFILRADTIKDGEDLQERWGDNLIGLTNESIGLLNQEIIPELVSYIVRKLLS